MTEKEHEWYTPEQRQKMLNQYGPALDELFGDLNPESAGRVADNATIIEIRANMEQDPELRGVARAYVDEVFGRLHEKFGKKVSPVFEDSLDAVTYALPLSRLSLT
jgi:hypothetical protein